MMFRNGIVAAAAAIGLSMVAVGQTPPTPATCTTPPTSVTALNIERVIPLADVLTTITPNADAATLAALAGGALEIHELLVYNTQTSTMTSTVFLLPAGSPTPSPAGTITFANTAMVTTSLISSWAASCVPTPSLIFHGTVIAGAGTLYGPTLVGANTSTSLGYTLDSPAKINNVAETIAGAVTAWSAAANGTVTTAGGTSGGGGGGGGTTGITIVLKAAGGTIATPNANNQAPVSPFFLDATGSTGTGALTFAWSTPAGQNSPVAFVGTGTPGQILVQFPGPGDYNIVITVTDSTGASKSATFTFTYTGRPK